MNTNKRNLLIVVALLVVVFAIAGLIVLNADDDDSSLAGTAGGDKNKTEEPKDGQNDLTGDMPAFNAEALAEYDLEINVNAFCSEVDPPSTDYEYGFVMVNKGRDMAEELSFAVTTNRSLDAEADPNSMSLDRPGMTGGQVERSTLHEGTFKLEAGQSFEFIPEETETFSDMELNRTIYFEIEGIDAYEVQCLPEDQANAAATATAHAEANQ
jgi:hypothetical protein